MAVRIFFRGLVLFHLPKEGAPGKIVAELISDPRRSTQPGPGGGRPHDHRAEIQVVTATGVQNAAPQGLNAGAHVDLTIPGAKSVRRSRSFRRYVPKLANLVAQATNPEIPNVPRSDRDPRYVRNTITIDRGTIRARSLVTWDAGGFLLPGQAGGVGDAPAAPATLKFMGCDVSGHMANECVVDIPDADSFDLSSPNQPGLNKPYKAPPPNRPAAFDSIDVLITNYEPQRRKPSPWGMDFQWLFAAAGYGEVDLNGDEFRRFVDRALRFDSALFWEDWEELLEGTIGMPFPYITGEDALTSVASIATDIDARPVCVPGDDGS